MQKIRRTCCCGTKFPPKNRFACLEVDRTGTELFSVREMGACASRKASDVGRGASVSSTDGPRIPSSAAFCARVSSAAHVCAREAAGVPTPFPAPAFFDLLALPRPLALAIIALLPTEQRVRCLAVSRGWSALLADKSVWLGTVDLSVASGETKFSKRRLRRAISNAPGPVCVLVLTGQSYPKLTSEMLLAAVTTTAGTLRHLLLCGWSFHCSDLERLLTAAPRLCRLEADCSMNIFEHTLCAMLRNEPPFGPLKLRRLCLSHTKHVEVPVGFAAALACHASLRQLELSHVIVRSDLVNALASLRLVSVQLRGCYIPPEIGPLLTMKLWTPCMRKLSVEHQPE